MPGSRRKPELTTVGIVIYRPMRTGEPCHWAIWLNNRHASVILQVTKGQNETQYRFERPLYKEPWETNNVLEIVHCGTLTEINASYAWELCESLCIRNEPGYHSQDWVFGCLAMIYSRAGMKIVPGVTDILQAKRLERPEGVMGNAENPTS